MSSLQAGTCLIGGQCFVPGQLNPTNPLLECDPTKQQFGWSTTGKCGHVGVDLGGGS